MKIPAATKINADDISPAEYVLRLSKANDTVVEHLSEHSEDQSLYLETKNLFAKTWFISFELIRRCDPLSADYLTFMVGVERKMIPVVTLAQSRVEVENA